MAARMTPRFRDLTDVDWETFADGEVATYGSGTDTLTGEPGGGDAVADLATHAADTTNVHGIVDTTVLASDAELAAHIADTTFVHGVSNTSDLATDAEVASAVSTHSSDTTSVHGITDTTVLATDAEVASAVAAHESDTTVHGVDTANVPLSGEKAALAGTSGTPSGSNKYVTEDDPGLGGADLSDAVILAPDVDRNVVQPTDDGAVALTIEAHATQAANLQEWKNPSGDVFVVVGNGVAEGAFVSAQTAGAGTFVWSTGGISAWPAATGDRAFGVSLYTDAEYRFQVLGDGTAQWGDGTDAPDTTLERTGVGELSLNGEPVVVDDDTRLTDARTPTTHSHAEADVTGLTAALAAKQPVDSDLTSLAALTTTSFGRGLLELANQGALLSAAGAAAASHSHAESDVTNLVSDLAGKQVSDATLTALAGLATGADKFPYSTGTDTFSQATVTSAARDLLDDTTAAAMRTTLGVSGTGWRTPVYITGKYYGAPGATSGQQGILSQSRWTCCPFVLDATTTFDRIGVLVGNVVTSLVYRLGIYSYSLTTGKPETLILDAGTVTGATAGVQAATISQQLTAGAYWLVCIAQGAAIGSGSIYHVTLTNLAPIQQAGWNPVVATYYAEGITGALPGSAPALTDHTAVSPHIMLRAA